MRVKPVLCLVVRPFNHRLELLKKVIIAVLNNRGGPSALTNILSFNLSSLASQKVLNNEGGLSALPYGPSY